MSKTQIPNPIVSLWNQLNKNLNKNIEKEMQEYREQLKSSIEPKVLEKYYYKVVSAILEHTPSIVPPKPIIYYLDNVPVTFIEANRLRYYYYKSKLAKELYQYLRTISRTIEEELREELKEKEDEKTKYSNILVDTKLVIIEPRNLKELKKSLKTLTETNIPKTISETIKVMKKWFSEILVFARIEDNEVEIETDEEDEDNYSLFYNEYIFIALSNEPIPLWITIEFDKEVLR